MSKLVLTRVVKPPVHPDPVDYVTSGVVTVQNTNTLNVPVPDGATASVGDWLIVGVSAPDKAKQTITAPSGANLVWDQENESGFFNFYLYYFVLDADDLNANKTFTFTGAGTHSKVAVWGIYRNVGGFSNRPIGYMTSNIEQANARTPRFCTIITGPRDRIIGVAGIACTVNIADNQSEATSAPNGFTLRQTGSKGHNPGFSNTRGALLCDRVGDPAPDNPNPGVYDQELTYTTRNSNNRNIAVIFALHPPNPHWTEIQKVPETLEGCKVTVYSHSSNAMVDKEELNYRFNSREPYGNRVAKALQASTYRNLARPGAACEDITSFAFGNASRHTQTVEGNTYGVEQVGTWTPDPLNNPHLVILDTVGNNSIRLSNGAQALTSFRNALRSLIRRVCSSVIYPSTHASITQVGTWTNSSSTAFTNGLALQTDLPGSRLEKSFTDKSSVDIVVIATDNRPAVNGGLGGTGSTYAIKVDGVTIGTGTVHNEGLDSQHSSHSYRLTHKTITITGIPAGTHTVAVEHTGSIGHILIVDSFQEPSSTPPWVLVMKMNQIDPASMAEYNITQAEIDDYNDALEDVVADENNPYLIVVDMSDVWDYDGDVATDGVHQNERGFARFAHFIMQLLFRKIR